MKSRKGLLLIAAVTLLIVLCFSSTAFADDIDSGTCGVDGDNLTWVLSSDGVLTISGTGDMLDYTEEVGSPWYSNHSKITGVVIEDGVTSIGGAAFMGCNGLTSVTLPNSVTSIGNAAFTDCSSLTSVTLPSSITSIRGSAFYGCSSLTSVTIPNSITSIEKNVFKGCSSLTSVTLPNSVTNIKDYAFNGCRSLTSITIPKSVTNIGRYVFASCDSLNKVYISDLSSYLNINYSSDNPTSHPTYNGADLYINGELTTNISIPEGVTNIEPYAFYRCNSLINVTIPEGVTSIGAYAFFRCESLTNVNIPEGVTDIGTCTFRRCISLTKAVIPESMTSIGEGAFYDCVGLKSIAILAESTQIVSGEISWVSGGSEESGDLKVNKDIIVYVLKDTITESNVVRNKTKNVRYITKEGEHYFGDVIITPPTCTEDGIEDVQCVVCGESKGQMSVIPAKGHYLPAYMEGMDYENPTCTESGYDFYYCASCGQKIIDKVYDNALGHEWYLADISIEQGEKIFKCSRCGETKIEKIPTDTSATDDNTPGTGDDSTGTGDDAPAPDTTADPADELGIDGTEIGQGASSVAADAKLTTTKTDKDIKGSVYSKLQLKQKKVTKSSITISWTKVTGAKKYVVYAAKSGKTNKLKKITTTSKLTYALKKVNKKNLVKGTYYKFMVVALNSKGKVVTTSKYAHIATLGKNAASNPAKVTTKAKKDKVTLKVKKTFKLAGTYTSSAKKYKIKKILGMRYESTNTKVATVSSTGVIKGIKKGTCYVYAYAQNGIAKRIKVTVK